MAREEREGDRRRDIEDEIERELSSPCPICELLRKRKFGWPRFCVWCGDTNLYNRTQFAGRAYDVAEAFDEDFFEVNHAPAREKWLRRQW